jgi:hypothetical protein
MVSLRHKHGTRPIKKFSLAFNWSALSRVWAISSGINPCFLLAGGLCKFYANAGGKRPMQRQPPLVQQAAANPLLSTHNYAPLVIGRNETNKQLTLLRQRKLALTGRNM